MPPTAQITQHTTTSQKQAGTVISLSATGSTLGTGRWHTHKFEWTVDHTSIGGGSWSTLVVRDPRIGQNVDAAQKFRGFNFEFLADEPGDYDVTLVVTDEAEQSDTDSIRITIAASTRVSYFVDAQNGDNANSGTSEANPWRTLAYAVSQLSNTSDWRLNLRAGQAHSLPSAVTIEAATNIEIGRYGTGTDPVIEMSAAITLGSGVENFYVHHLRQRPLNVASTDCWVLSGRHGVIRNVFVEGSLTGNRFFFIFELNTDQSPQASHLCFLNCTTQASDRYSIIRELTAIPRNLTILGGSFGPSVVESIIRHLDMNEFAAFCCDLDASPDVEPKSTIRFQFTTFGSCYRCRLIGGDCKIGQIEDIEQMFFGFAQHIRIDACRLRGSPIHSAFAISDNVDGFALVNNYIELSEAASALGLSGMEEGIRRGLMAHNTFDNVMGGKAINEFSDEDNVALTLKNNLFIMDNFTILNFRYFNRQRGNFGGDIAAWTISHNVWTPPPPPPPDDNDDVWQVGFDLYDLAGWNGLAQVSDEATANIVLDSNLRPLLPNVVPKVPGVFEDYYGNPRTTVWAGAVGPAPV